MIKKHQRKDGRIHFHFLTGKKRTLRRERFIELFTLGTIYIYYPPLHGKILFKANHVTEQFSKWRKVYNNPYQRDTIGKRPQTSKE